MIGVWPADLAATDDIFPVVVLLPVVRRIAAQRPAAPVLRPTKYALRPESE